jgi:hypothetical protein
MVMVCSVGFVLARPFGSVWSVLARQVSQQGMLEKD